MSSCQPLLLGAILQHQSPAAALNDLLACPSAGSASGILPVMWTTSAVITSHDETHTFLWAAEHQTTVVAACMQMYMQSFSINMYKHYK